MYGGICAIKYSCHTIRATGILLFKTGDSLPSLPSILVSVFLNIIIEKYGALAFIIFQSLKNTFHY